MKFYIDESSQTKFRYMLLGGLCVPLSHSAAFEADIISHRDHRRASMICSEADDCAARPARSQRCIPFANNSSPASVTSVTSPLDHEYELFGKRMPRP